MLEPLDFNGFEKYLLESEQNEVHIVGFSLGAMTALKIAANYPEKISKLTLISPAAPLELGEFLPHMAGQLVFSMASKGAIPFTIFTTFQCLGVAIAPSQIVKTMFKGSPKADLTLLTNATFKETLISSLKFSLGKNRRSYSNAVREYVQPWAHQLKDIKCAVTIYHGSEDNWAPIEMSRALIEKMDKEPDLIVFENLGHYSTLSKALPIIFSSLK